MWQVDDQNAFFESAIMQATGKLVEVQFMHFMTGGCINQTIRLDTSGGTFFLKWNEHPTEDVFETEAKGLDLLRDKSDIRVPEILGTGYIRGKGYLLLEFIHAKPHKRNYWEDLGRKLANMHRSTQANFGLSFDNFIGSLPQQNDFHKDWLSFFMESRLRPQFGKAYYDGLISESYMKKLDKLHKRLEGFFPKEPPALLHGDLWTGNVMSDETGSACLVDPAVYYGHREAELAFTKLFGDFEPGFYNAYHEAYPISPGFRDRHDVYNLYPLMVHVNLFGTAYLSAVDKTLKRLL